MKYTYDWDIRIIACMGIKTHRHYNIENISFPNPVHQGDDIPLNAVLLTVDSITHKPHPNGKSTLFSEIGMYEDKEYFSKLEEELKKYKYIRIA